MNNLQKIEHHQTKCHFLFIFHLTCSKFFALKGNALTHSFQNYLSNHTITLIRFSLWEDQDVPLKEGTGGTPCKPRRLNFPLCWKLPPIKNWHSPCILTSDHISGKKKVSLTAFRQNFNKNFACSVHFQLHNHDLFEKIWWN